MIKKPKILFCTYGELKTGMGHVFRDLELAKILKSKARVSFYYSGDSRIEAIIKDEKNEDVTKGNLNKAIQDRSPRLLIYDRPYSLGPLPAIKPNVSLKILALDYYFYGDKRIDCTVNLVKRYSKTDRISIPQIFEGLKFSIIKDNVLRRKRIQRKITNKINKVIITFGGSDPNNNTIKALKMLSLTKRDCPKIEVLIGHLFRYAYDIKKQGRVLFKNRVIFLKDVKDMGSLMSGADVIICGGGTTLMESLYLAKSVIAMPQTSEELDFIYRGGIDQAVLLLPENLTMKQKLERVNIFFSDSILRRKLAQKGKMLFDGKGKRRIVDIALNLCKR
jgi:spore coat polysaccharide biosynthesis predicted glycosyltransferase SpsG